MTNHAQLKQYRARRTFKTTSEPYGKKSTQKLTDHPIFVIQKHAASHLHYDLRLEIDGVLVSWAVPKGPSTNPRIKRLAIQTENHPLDYANFEGVIQPGNYGAGTVMVWDIGTYTNIKDPVLMQECLRNGHVEINIQGSKLQGNYVLIKTNKPPDDWLLIKMRDAYANAQDDIVKSEPTSALTQRTMQEIKRERSAPAKSSKAQRKKVGTKKNKKINEKKKSTKKLS